MSRRLSPALLVLAVAAGPLAAQQPPPAQPRTPIDANRAAISSALRYYADPAIQAELKLTDEQKEKLKKIPDDVLAKYEDAIEKEQSSSQVAAEKAAAERAERVKQFDDVLEKNLTAEQRKRLDQLAVRSMGVSAFGNPEVTKALGLTTESRAKLTQMQQAGRDKLNKEFPDFVPFNADAATREKYTAAQRKMTQDTFDQFVGTFTADQKKTWKELTGEPSEAATAGGWVATPFTFGSQSALRYQLVSGDQVLAELKVEKAARDALAEGLKALAPTRTSSPVRPGGFPVRVQTTLSREAAAQANDLLTPSQAKRLEQVRFQLGGLNVFSPMGAAPDNPFQTQAFAATPGTPAIPLLRLTLTPAQVVKIDAIFADHAKKLNDLPAIRFDRLGPDTAAEELQKARAERSQKLAELNEKTMTAILATFDDGQKGVWKDLAGEPFDTTKVASLNTTGRDSFSIRTQASILTRWTSEAGRRNRAGEYAAALAVYDDLLRLAPNNPLYVLSKARLLASCPSEWVRDGKQAVELMTKVMADTKEPTNAQYEVLAMAHAECGQFDEAVKAQLKAIELLPAATADTGGFPTTQLLKPRYEEQLKLYQEKKPYRNTPLATTTPTGGR